MSSIIQFAEKTNPALNIAKGIAIIIGAIAVIAVGVYAYSQYQKFQASLNPATWFGLAPTPPCLLQQGYQSYQCRVGNLLSNFSSPFGINYCQTGQTFVCATPLPLGYCNIPYCFGNTYTCSCPVACGVYA